MSFRPRRLIYLALLLLMGPFQACLAANPPILWGSGSAPMFPSPGFACSPAQRINFVGAVVLRIHEGGTAGETPHYHPIQPSYGPAILRASPSLDPARIDPNNSDLCRTTPTVELNNLTESCLMVDFYFMVDDQPFAGTTSSVFLGPRESIRSGGTAEPYWKPLATDKGSLWFKASALTVDTGC